MEVRAAATLARYPLDPHQMMPTTLGNVLRRAEGIAGERYGLSTVHTYPRLYPYLSPRLDAEIGNQLDVLDTTATFVLLFAIEAAVTAPLVLRWDEWSGIPVVFVALALIAYAGAIRAAQKQGDLLEVAFDLHRFDLISGLHLPLPPDPARELKQNRLLTGFLSGPLDPSGLRPPPQWRYAHPQDPPLEALRAPVPAAGDSGGKDEGAGKEGGGDDGKGGGEGEPASPPPAAESDAGDSD